MPEQQVLESVPTGGRFARRSANLQADRVHRVALVVFAGTTVLACGTALAGVRLPSVWGWFYAVHIIVATVTILAGLARRLPLQNVLTCAVALLVTSGMVLALVAFAVQDGIRLQHLRTGAGAELADLIHWWAWPAPWLCVAVLLASRQSAKVLLQSWRREKQYGWWLLGLASFLAWAVLIVAEPYADHVLAWWSWPDHRPGRWYGMPLPWLAGILVVVVVLLLAAGVWLIPKRRTGRPPDLEPVWVWGGLVLWLTLGNLRAGFWAAAGIGALLIPLVIGLAWSAARTPLNSPESTGGPASGA